MAARHQASEDVVCLKIRNNVFFEGNLCYHAHADRNRVQTEIFGEFLRALKPKNRFLTEVAEAAA
ncbi:MAG: hypothetical protein C4567_12600 [Deltaproteobacteria bacterium]|nr:MAG: hypothetical protein C4567_12600 [Deltaproteobacteria bacterium]